MGEKGKKQRARFLKHTRKSSILKASINTEAVVKINRGQKKASIYLNKLLFSVLFNVKAGRWETWRRWEEPVATPDSISASLKQTEECVREAAAPGGLTFSPVLFFVILPFHPSPTLPVCFLFKKSAVSPGCKTFFLRLHLSSQIKSLRLCNSASVHVHTCVFSDDLCDTFF